MNRYISILSSLLITTASIAQTLSGDTINRTVLVESTYNPIVVSAVKRNFIPDAVEPSMNRTSIVYADKAMPITRLQRMVLPVETVTIAQAQPSSDYLHLAYGTHNNLDGMAAYHLLLGNHHTIILDGKVNGWNGNFYTPDEGWFASRYFHDEANLRYRFTFSQGELGAALFTGLSSFNYLTTEDFNHNLELNTDQRSTHVGGKVYVKGNVDTRFHYHADITYTHAEQQVHFGIATPSIENHIQSRLHLDAQLNNYGTFSLKLANELLSYPQSTATAINYITLTPQWSSSFNRFSFTTGVNLDLSNQSYARFKASPSCSITYNSEKNLNASLTLDGGHQLPTYSYLESLSPYWMRTPELQSSYTYLNAILSANIRLFEGLHLHADGGYRIIGSALFETISEINAIRYTGFVNRNTQLAHVTTKLSYNYKQQFSCFAQGTYNHWMPQNDDRDILTRAPQIDTKVGIKAHLFAGLSAHTNLRYVLFAADSKQERETSIIDLNLGFHYALNTRWGFYLDGHNLLNRHYQYYTGYPSQGISAIAGVAFKF